ncbi:hepatic lectin-like [Sinocyclocheilus anshuiensis]|uniref:hepatic lectin-like n=1 Tax=Sinocyclocheilus anshuiensis TaxID=1608454 RepID=UPI0007B9C895|nr:PREDICTED: hepatic lectin-like [Sinocyclocheilus anshuiensis]
MQSNKLSDNVEGNPDRVDPFYQQVQEFISRVVQKRPDYWIGLKRDKTAQWSWVNGDNYHSTPHFWDENEPAHWDIESCAHLKGSDTVHRKLMHDADCRSERYHICERKLEKGMW